MSSLVSNASTIIQNCYQKPNADFDKHFG